MRTPKEYTDNIKKGIITTSMLETALYSVNKRAKNYRDAERKTKHQYGRYSKYADSSEWKKNEFYSKKDKLLSILEPICIHKEFAGYERTRIYDYEQHYADRRFYAWAHNQIVWENYYFDHDTGMYVEFFDAEDRSQKKYRYYLYYNIGHHTFHTPINNLEKYNLPVKEIGTLDTYGDDYLDLCSVQFVDKVIALINSGEYQYVQDVPDVLPEFPLFEEEHQKEEFANFPVIWQSISRTIADICLSMPIKLPEDLSKYYALFSVRQKKKKDVWKKPQIIKRKIKVPFPENEDKVYEFIKTSVWTTKNELACKLLSKESPAYMLLYDYTYERQCRQKAMKELEYAAAKLYHGDNEVSMHNILQMIQNK